jgi:AbrB family looped-hinge helix DNA binding protein
MSEIVTKRGQVVVPQWVVKRLRLKPGRAVDFIFDADGRAIIVKADNAAQIGRALYTAPRDQLVIAH